MSTNPFIALVLFIKYSSLRTVQYQKRASSSATFSQFGWFVIDTTLLMSRPTLIEEATVVKGNIGTLTT